MNAEQGCILPQPHHVVEDSEQESRMDSGYYSDESDYNDIIIIRRVPIRTSTEQDTGDSAKLQALKATQVNETNEQLVRSHHPSLAPLQDVWVSETVFGPPVWLVNCPVKGVEAAGRPIHLFQGDYTEYIPREVIPPISPDSYNIPFRDEISPREFLTPKDIECFQRLFPRAVGVEVLVAGFIIILFRSTFDLENAYKSIWPRKVAGIRLFFELAPYEWTECDVLARSSTELSGGSRNHHCQVPFAGIRVATILGTAYVWRPTKRYNHVTFVLWHTGASVGAVPGSVPALCLGDPSNLAPGDLVYQAYQRECLLGGDIDSPTMQRGLVKAGLVPLRSRDFSVIRTSERVYECRVQIENDAPEKLPKEKPRRITPLRDPSQDRGI